MTTETPTVDDLMANGVHRTTTEILHRRCSARSSDRDGITPLIGAVLQDQHEERRWGERHYLSDVSARNLVYPLHDHAKPARPELLLAF